MGWIYLVGAGIFEVIFAGCLKASCNFARFWPVVGFIFGAVVSLFFLSRAMQSIPMGTAYAVWTGIGSVGTVLLGITLYGDPVNLGRLFFLTVLVASIVGLKFFSGSA